MAQDFLEGCKPYLNAHQSPQGSGILDRRKIVLSFLDSDFMFQRGQVAECVAEIRRCTGVEISAGSVSMDAMCYRKAQHFLGITDRAERSAFLERIRKSQNPEYRIVKVLSDAGITDWETLEGSKIGSSGASATHRLRTLRRKLREKLESKAVAKNPAAQREPDADAAVNAEPFENPVASPPPSIPTNDQPMVRIPKTVLDKLDEQIAELLSRFQAQSESLKARTTELAELKVELSQLKERVVAAEEAVASTVGRPFNQVAEEYSAFARLAQLLIEDDQTLNPQAIWGVSPLKRSE